MKYLPLAAILPIVSAICNPLTSSNCPSDPALGASFKEDFTSGIGSHFEVLDNPGSVTFGENGVSITMNKQLDNPSIKSNFYIMFGKVEVVLKASPGTGIISSFFLQSDDLDEIDIELFGGNTQVQSNFFLKGDTTTYTRGQYLDVTPDPSQSFHTYTLDWTSEALTWAIDGNVVRTLLPSDPQGYPQTPMQILAGIWAGGDASNAQGTIDWAGGPTDYSQLPFSMEIKSLIVSDYSSGKSYSYGDTSGSWSSIKADGGSVNGRIEQGQKEFSSLQGGTSPAVSQASSIATTSTSVSTTPITTKPAPTSAPQDPSTSQTTKVFITTSSVSTSAATNSTKAPATKVTKTTTSSANAVTFITTAAVESKSKAHISLLNPTFTIVSTSESLRPAPTLQVYQDVAGSLSSGSSVLSVAMVIVSLIFL